MGYIGNRPADSYTSFAVQHFTTSATTTYSLDNPVANENEIALFINNVRQEPGSSYAYTASGTTLTLSAATSASDTMYCVFIGKAVQTVTPASGSVTNDMLAGSIATSKLADITANGLTNINYQSFSSSGTYTPTTGMAFCEVYCTGGGGGGGGVDGDDTSLAHAAGGGGAGGTAIKIYTASELGANATVTIGSGGSGATNGGNGASGGNSSFAPAGAGGTITGNGGSGSSGFNGGNPEVRGGGSGSTASGGDINITGNSGGVGSNSDESAIGGQGGNSYFSGGAIGGSVVRLNATSNGADAVQGAGGGGGAVRNSVDIGQGGDGGNGIIIVKEFING